MVTDLWGIISDVVTGFLGTIISAFSGITEIFYIDGVDGGFTVIGQLLLIGLGMTVVMFAFKFIRGLIKQ